MSKLPTKSPEQKQRKKGSIWRTAHQVNLRTLIRKSPDEFLKLQQSKPWPERSTVINPGQHVVCKVANFDELSKMDFARVGLFSEHKLTLGHETIKTVQDQKDTTNRSREFTLTQVKTNGNCKIFLKMRTIFSSITMKNNGGQPRVLSHTQKLKYTRKTHSLVIGSNYLDWTSKDLFNLFSKSQILYLLPVVSK